MDSILLRSLPVPDPESLVVLYWHDKDDRHDFVIFFFQAEDGIRDYKGTGVQTCALPISNVAVITTGPGLIMPMATATRKSRSFSQCVCCTRPFSRKGTMTRPLPKVREPALRKKTPSSPRTLP